MRALLKHSSNITSVQSSHTITSALLPTVFDQMQRGNVVKCSTDLERLNMVTVRSLEILFKPEFWKAGAYSRVNPFSNNGKPGD